MLGVFFDCSPYVLKQSFEIKPELANLASLVSQLA